MVSGVHARLIYITHEPARSYALINHTNMRVRFFFFFFHNTLHPVLYTHITTVAVLLSYVLHKFQNDLQDRLQSLYTIFVLEGLEILLCLIRNK
ncbi:hypothetical protein C2G38_555539 [Gigaspora rosea]|uniref:Uncharacterized protein n=1 Tax=Gigaspora rosea TaxID=44941 RepID=A0A397U6M6_9GLOM|nr:hypothetical protein C2G38_555539 [Gigaspora rosea]